MSTLHTQKKAELMQLHTTHANGCEPVRARSRQLFSRAQNLLPAGVSRSTIERDPIPAYALNGRGAYLTDADGNKYLDLNNNFTTLIHGHCFEPVTEAVAQILRSGTCFANPTEHELNLAELLIDRIPAVERIRFVNSGTEAVMFAIKAARAFTGKPAIARFEGSYHGAYDWAEAGQSGTVSADGTLLAKPAYSGCPTSVCENIVLLEFNNIQYLERSLNAHAHKLSAILIDPMPSRAGLLKPDSSFIEALNVYAKKHGILVIADEVLNLRQAYDGASARYGLTPDLITTGKIIGGGFPIGAIGGRVDVMSVFDDTRKASLVAQGGTFSANPVSMIAGKIAMEAMTRQQFSYLDRLGEQLCGHLRQCVEKWDAPFSITNAASLLRIHPKSTAPSSYKDAIMDVREAALMKAMSRFFFQHGIILPFGAAACLSTPMTDDDIGKIASVFDDFLKTQSRKN